MFIAVNLRLFHFCGTDKFLQFTDLQTEKDSIHGDGFEESQIHLHLYQESSFVPGPQD